MSERPVDARLDAFVDASIELNPLIATFVGIQGYDDKLPDFTPEWHQQGEDDNRAALAEVEALTPVDAREALAKAAFIERTSLEIETADAGYARSHVSVISSPIHGLREAFDLMPQSSEDDWATIGKRMALVPTAIEGIKATLLDEAVKGHVVAQRQYVEVADQIVGWTGGHGSPAFFDALAAQAPEALRTELGAQAAKATAAFANIGEFLTTTMAPRGLAKEAVGREHYALASRNYLGATIDLEETYLWGWEELKRLEDDMLRMADLIKPGSSIREAVAHLDTDPSTKLANKEELRDWMQALADRTIADLADTHFDIPEPIRRIECMIAPTQDGGIYYTGPSEDFSRPGRMWWSVPASVTDFSPWREMTTVYHEGVPGHHLQVGATTYRSELLNRWQRLFCWVSGHGEGWALYAERLMDELGKFPTPQDRMGFLDGQAFRAARVIIDIGMHLELEIPKDNPFGYRPGERWTPAYGREFMGQHCLMDSAFIDFEVKRYLGWPGQAPSYKVGEKMWLEAREDAKRRKGTAFDLKAFHTNALNLGSLGLDPFKAALAQI